MPADLKTPKTLIATFLPFITSEDHSSSNSLATSPLAHSSFIGGHVAVTQ